MIKMATTNQCEYSFIAGGRCKHEINKDKYCIFHDHNKGSKEYDARFWWRLKRLVLKGDGDWRGFQFPHVNLENVICPISITLKGANFILLSLKNSTFNKPVNASGAFFRGLVLSGCQFDESLSIREVKFSENVKITSTTINKGLIAHDCYFQKDLFISGTLRKVANFHRCHFAGKAEFVQTKTTTLSTTKSISTSLSSLMAITRPLNKNAPLNVKLKYYFDSYKQKVITKLKMFFAWINSTIKRVWKKLIQWMKKTFTNYRQRFPYKREDVKKYVLFDEKASLTYMTFSNPKKVLFKGVNLQQASFNGTDLRGATFIGNSWYQPKLGRNGLKDELSYLQTTEYYNRKESLPNLENTYRNIRFSLEENKDFGLANDFFVGEMEAKRRQLPFMRRVLFSVPAIYKLVSYYGTSPFRTGLIFCIGVCSHIAIVASIAKTPLYTAVKNVVVPISELDPSGSVGYWQQIQELFLRNASNTGLLDSISYTIQTMTLQKDKVTLLSDVMSNDPTISFVNTLFTLIGPILIGLFALTIRTRIKRN